MHYHLEIIMPPVDDVEAALGQILAPFDEDPHLNEGDESYTKNSFWDWYVIGGRFSGAKIEYLLGEEKIGKFQKHLSEIGITVSKLQAGKQRLHPESQIPAVDALWNKWFPDSHVKVCPLFDHYNDQYSKNESKYGDVMKFSEVPMGLRSNRIILAGLDYGGKKCEAKFMIEDKNWNGVTHVKTIWDGTLEHALEMAAEKGHVPRSDWLVVTVDYHS